MPSFVLRPPLLHVRPLLLHLGRLRGVALSLARGSLLALHLRLAAPALSRGLLVVQLLLLELTSLVERRSLSLGGFHLLLELDRLRLASLAFLLEARGFLLDSLPGGFQRRRGRLRGVQLRVQLLPVPIALVPVGLELGFNQIKLFLFRVQRFAFLP